MKPFRWQTWVRGIAAFALTLSAAKGAEPVNPTQLAQVQTFLDQYTALSRSQSPDFYDLYADRATVHVRVQGRDHEIVFLGRSYKDWSRQLLLLHQIAIDDSQFFAATVEEREHRVIIHAKRYATSRCFWDADYQVTLERQGTSNKIIDERLTTAPLRVCPRRQDESNAATSARADIASLAGASTWRPMSQEEIARSALRLAQEAAAIRGNEKSSSSALPPTSAGTSSRASTTADSDPVLITPSDH